jgi:acyl-CoA thioesterase FadM
LTSAAGYQTLIPFVVRHDASTSEYLVVIGHNTDAAGFVHFSVFFVYMERLRGVFKKRH